MTSLHWQGQGELTWLNLLLQRKAILISEWLNVQQLGRVSVVRRPSVQLHFATAATCIYDNTITVADWTWRWRGKEQESSEARTTIDHFPTSNHVDNGGEEQGRANGELVCLRNALTCVSGCGSRGREVRPNSDTCAEEEEGEGEEEEEARGAQESEWARGWSPVSGRGGEAEEDSGDSTVGIRGREYEGGRKDRTEARERGGEGEGGEGEKGGTQIGMAAGRVTSIAIQFSLSPPVSLTTTPRTFVSDTLPSRIRTWASASPTTT